MLCCGASNPRDIKVPGRDAGNIYFAVDFLTSVTKSLLDSDLRDNKFISAKGKHVLVIGGGDTGNDCVGTAIRLGAKSVTDTEGILEVLSGEKPVQYSVQGDTVLFDEIQNLDSGRDITVIYK